MKKYKGKFDLEERLIEFSLSVITIVEILPKTSVGRHFANQLIRSGTAPALQYAEAQSAESRRDFIHKMKISLKELRETQVCLKIIQRKPLIDKSKLINTTLKENNELISIFVTSIATARSNLRKST
ncbi:four helix bundle protein [Halalkalibaculum sp. DA3122]|uniref:four helix bundle protein n=1 Tax=unclassified Halalkalibaculum TaxID=2964617 RepID=UPI003755223E